MATTDALRSSTGTARLGRMHAGPPVVRLGVQWGYPFSLVRRLALVFAGVLAFCVAGAWLMAQPFDHGAILVHWIPAAAAILISLYVAELVGVTERPLPPLTTETLFWAIATSCLVMAVGYALISTYPPSTTMVCTAPIASALGVFLHRKWAEQRGAGEALPALLFAENHAEAKHGLAELADAPGIQVKAVILPASERRHAFLAGVPIDSAGQILRWVRERQVRLLILASPDAGSLRPALAPCVGAGCRIERIRDLTAKVHGRVDLLGSDEIDLLGRLTSGAHRFPLQRLVDLVLAMIVLVPALAIGGLVALGIKLTSKGPVFFRQTRMGRWGRRFGILKFRTMRRDAERESGPVFAQPDDPRITPFGRFLRKTRLDEIPQIVNVILGDMSLVGPRPERPHFVRTLRQGIPLYDARHSVRPGLTGWAQIRYRYGASDEDARNKLAYELFYILNRSLVFYLAVLLETVKVVLFRRGGQ